MACFTKTVVRIGVITALAGGAAVLLAGPHRVGAIMHQAKSTVGQAIDRQIEDPVALRAQIRRLEAQYPQKIAEVRGDLNDVQGQIAQLQRELAVSQKVIELASADLGRLDAGIEQARVTRGEHPGAVVRIAYDASNRAIALDEAYGKRSQIEQTRQLYTERVSELSVELDYLGRQEEQLGDLLSKLENERAEFQTQLVQLDSQIASMERNERLIRRLEERQSTIDRLSRFEAHSLDQVKQRIARIRAEQQSRLESIAGQEQAKDYLGEAQYLLDQEAQFEAFENSPGVRFNAEPKVIEIDPDAFGTHND